jgi:AbrB family looped-hinge helix DNA binding protein
METTTTAKGQIVIPSSIRRRLGIKEGTRIKIEENGNEIILKPITREYVHSLRGKFRGKGLMKALMAEKKRERSCSGKKTESNSPRFMGRHCLPRG